MRRSDQLWILDNLIRVVGQDVLFPGSTGFRVERGYAYADLLDTGKRILSLRDSPTQWERTAQRQVRLAEDAEAAGHDETARVHWYRASIYYGRAQWAIFEDAPLKRRLHGECVTCYERALRFTPSARRVELELDGQKVYAILHLPEGFSPEKTYPAVVFIPGMDMFKEEYPPLINNPFAKREMVVLSVDGPGQGETRVKGLQVTLTNHERSISKAIDYLQSLPYVDPEKIGCFGVSMGSYWAPKAASADERIKACAGTMGCYLSKDQIFNLAQPTFRINYQFMSGIADDEAFDAMAEQMTLERHAAEIRCPTLIATGELDELCPLEDAERFYEMLTCPKEMWIYDREFHPMGGAAADLLPAVADWLRDALEGRLPRNTDRIRRYTR